MANLKRPGQPMPAVIALARALPQWFNEEGIQQIAADIERQPGAVAEAFDEVVGFVTWTVGEHGSGEIGWIAVDSSHQRRGIGKRLLSLAEDWLRDSDVVELFVETLGDSVDYEPYERTRSFYRAVGFHDFRKVKTDNPGMPESLTLHKTLTPGRNDKAGLT
ncbi:MAG: GNAT family N-acetyltransferase [Acidimicrobiia bacterium]|nr:GNAT family N-acetyltransferase [Acidimicrobiia bacterium]